MDTCGRSARHVWCAWYVPRRSPCSPHLAGVAQSGEILQDEMNVRHPHFNGESVWAHFKCAQLASIQGCTAA